jgi:hypothetical protein
MSTAETHENPDRSVWVVVGCCTIALCLALCLAFYARSIDPSPLMTASGLG